MRLRPEPKTLRDRSNTRTDRPSVSGDWRQDAHVIVAIPADWHRYGPF
jgi:hypothetical protein